MIISDNLFDKKMTISRESKDYLRNLKYEMLHNYSRYLAYPHLNWHTKEDVLIDKSAYFDSNDAIEFIKCME